MVKKRIFINSTGRTATQFFAKYLNIMIADSVSLHEPGTPWVSKPRRLIKQIKDYGIYHLTIGQNRNDYSMYKLSRDFVAGDINKHDTRKNILKINGKVDKLYDQAKVIVYSSGHIYGILGQLDKVYDDSNFVFVIRDPRDWIFSALNKVEFSLYGPVEIFFKKISLQPSCFKDDPYKENWKKLSKFEKYCWFYNKLNENAIRVMKNKPNFKVFRYEDIFLSENKVENFKELMDFATTFKSGKVECDFKADLIDNKIDSKQKSSTWENWSDEQAQIMMKHCGKIMAEFGYGQEEKWKRKINKIN